MATLLFQCLSSLLALQAGILALVAAGRIPNRFGSTWFLTGAAFTALGVSGILQDLGAVWAFFSGRGSPVYDFYMRWSPVGNYSRAFVVITFALLLTATPLFLSRLPWRSVRRLFFGGLLMGAVLGGWVGSETGAIVSAKHWSWAAVLDLLELLALLSALLTGVFLASMDRLLWTLLAVYSFHVALNVAYFSALAWIRIPGMWSPRPIQIAIYISATYLIVLLGVAYRLRLARQGRQVGPLIEPLPVRSPSLADRF